MIKYPKNVEVLKEYISALKDLIPLTLKTNPEDSDKSRELKIRVVESTDKALTAERDALISDLSNESITSEERESLRDRLRDLRHDSIKLKDSVFASEDQAKSNDTKLRAFVLLLIALPFYGEKILKLLPGDIQEISENEEQNDEENT